VNVVPRSNPSFVPRASAACVHPVLGMSVADRMLSRKHIICDSKAGHATAWKPVCNKLVHQPLVHCRPQQDLTVQYISKHQKGVMEMTSPDLKMKLPRDHQKECDGHGGGAL
jgi:hypothetical protein